MKHFFSILTAVFSVLAFFVSCGGSESGESASIYGHVTDFATGENLTNANVHLSDGKTTLTGSDGIYEFRDLEPSCPEYYVECCYDITVSKDGYNEFRSDCIPVKDKMIVYDIQLVKYKACEKQPCGNHGTCVAEDDNDYYCICDDGYDHDHVTAPCKPE